MSSKKNYENRSLREIMRHYSFERKDNVLTFTLHDLKFQEGDIIVMLLPRYREIEIIVGRGSIRYMGTYAPPIVERYGAGGTLSEHILDAGLGLNPETKEFQIRLNVFKNLEKLPRKHIVNWLGINEEAKQYHKGLVYKNGQLRKENE